MEKFTFLKKVISYLSEINRGTQDHLIEMGWITQEEANKIETILTMLNMVDNSGEKSILTSKGLNILLYYKMGKINQEYDEKVLELLTTN
jgi:hypothetical protein